MPPAPRGQETLEGSMAWVLPKEEPTLACCMRFRDVHTFSASFSTPSEEEWLWSKASAAVLTLWQLGHKAMCKTRDPRL